MPPPKPSPSGAAFISLPHKPPRGAVFLFHARPSLQTSYLKQTSSGFISVNTEAWSFGVRQQRHGTQTQPTPKTTLGRPNYQ